MKVPADLKYTENDEWIRLDGETGFVGITDYAQDELSDVVYLEFTVTEGDKFEKGESFGTVESVKAAADVYFPVSGKATEINNALEETPELINSDPYGEAWMIKIEITDLSELDDLMDADAYNAYCEERE